jgi:hypothetical protein
MKNDLMYAVEYAPTGEYKIKIEKGIKSYFEDPKSLSKEIDLDAIEYATLSTYWGIVVELSSKGRKLPLSKTEVMSTFRPKVVKNLKSKGVLKEVSLPVSKNGKPQGNRTFITLTEEGRFICRRDYEKVPSETSGTGSPSLGGVNGQRESTDSSEV